MLILYPLFFSNYIRMDIEEIIFLLGQVFSFREIACLNQSLSAEIIEEFIAVYLSS